MKEETREGGRTHTHTHRQERRSNKIIIERGENRKEMREGEEKLRGGQEENAYYR